MRRFAIKAATLAIAFGQVHGQSGPDVGVGLPAPWRSNFLASQPPSDNASSDTLVDRLGNVVIRPVKSFGERAVEEVGSTVSTSFAFVPGHYYTSNYFSRVITEYDVAGIVVGSYMVPASLGEEVKGLAFGADGLLYASLSRDIAGFTVLALKSNGDVEASYSRSIYTAGNLSFGKIAMDNQYLYVCGQDVLTRFLLGDPSSGTTIYSQIQIVDVKPLPNGHLFVASRYYVDEITVDGVFVRRVQLTGGQSFTDIRGMEYDPRTNILFVTHLGHSDFFDRIIRVDAATGNFTSTVFDYPDDMFLDSSGNLLVGSRSQIPTFFSRDNLLQGNSLHAGQQMFVTQYVPSTGLKH